MDERKGGLWDELKHRKVPSAAAGYAAGAFVLLQLGEILFPVFGLADAAMRALIGVVIAAFPVILALAWVFDVRGWALHRTRDGGEVAAGAGGSRAHSVVLVAGILVFAAAGGFLALYGVLRVDAPVATTAPTGGTAIAVLPFVDMSETRDQAYLGDGVAEEVLNILAGVEGLRVAARTSSFAFRETTEDIREIGRRLGVTAVLEGSVRREGQMVRVTAQLIDTGNGFHIWSGNFDRNVDDLFAVQDEIATAIVAELLGRLELAQGTATRHEPPREAVDAYWRGRAEWGRRGPAGIPAAIALFNEAVALDSLYAEAFAGLADSYALLPQVAPGTDALEAWDRAEGYALVAIGLNDALADPHASLGLVRAFRGDRVGALESLGQAIRRNGSYASAYHWRANVLAEMGQLLPALVDADRAATLDPLSVSIATDRAYILLWDGRLDDAAAEFERAIRMDFGYAKAQFGQALVALARGEAVSVHMALAQWTAVSGLPPAIAAELAPAMLAFGTTGVAGRTPAGLGGLVEQQRVSAGTAASLAALVGARDEAVAWLRRAVDDRSWVDQYLSVNTIYDPLRDDPAFQEVLDEVATS